MRGLYGFFVEDFILGTMILALAAGALFLAFVHDTTPTPRCYAGDVRVNGVCVPGPGVR